MKVADLLSNFFPLSLKGLLSHPILKFWLKVNSAAPQQVAWLAISELIATDFKESVTGPLSHFPHIINHGFRQTRTRISFDDRRNSLPTSKKVKVMDIFLCK